MSKRLQVIVDDAEMKEIRNVARRHRVTVAEWVRSVLREARRKEPVADAARKLDALRIALEHDFPAGEIAEINKQIERGYFEESR